MLYKRVLIYLVRRCWLKNGTLTFPLFSPYQTESFTKGLRLVRAKQGNDKVFHFLEKSSFSKTCNFFLKNRIELYCFFNSPTWVRIWARLHQCGKWNKNHTFFCDKNARKAYLWYSEHAENIIHRKISIFYIKAIPHIFSQLRKQKYFFELDHSDFQIFFGHFGF